MDTEKLKEISELIRLVQKTDSDYEKIFYAIQNIENINSTYLDDNILKILCQGNCKKIVTEQNGNYNQVFNKIEFDKRIEYINICLEREVNKGQKFGRYNAPLLFFVEDEYLFEYLCSIGFNPNERLSISGFEGRPYFSLHHDFQMSIFQIALKNGFDITQKSNDNQEIIHLIFNQFIEFDTSTIEMFASIFKDTLNVPYNNGLNCLQRFILGADISEFMVANLAKMVEVGFDKNYRTENEIIISEYIIPSRSSAIDLLRIKNNNVNYDRNLVLRAEAILKPIIENGNKKKWWKFKK